MALPVAALRMEMSERRLLRLATPAMNSATSPLPSGGNEPAVIGGLVTSTTLTLLTDTMEDVLPSSRRGAPLAPAPATYTRLKFATSAPSSEGRRERITRKFTVPTEPGSIEIGCGFGTTHG